MSRISALCHRIAQAKNIAAAVAAEIGMDSLEGELIREVVEEALGRREGPA